MKGLQHPKKSSYISWIIMGIGTLLALVGAMMTREYRLNLCLFLGLAVIVGGIVYHLMMVRCPHCGHSLAGYSPLPRVCPKCEKYFDK